MGQDWDKARGGWSWGDGDVSGPDSEPAGGDAAGGDTAGGSWPGGGTNRVWGSAACAGPMVAAVIRAALPRLRNQPACHRSARPLGCAGQIGCPRQIRCPQQLASARDFRSDRRLRPHSQRNPAATTPASHSLKLTTAAAAAPRPRPAGGEPSPETDRWWLARLGVMAIEMLPPLLSRAPQMVAPDLWAVRQLAARSGYQSRASKANKNRYREQCLNAKINSVARQQDCC